MATTVATGKKIERKYVAHYINSAAVGAVEAAYTRLGKDLEEYTVERNATVDKKQNIFGETSVTLSAYEKSGVVDPYYAVVGDPLFVRLQSILDGDLTLDDCNADVVTVKLWDVETTGVYPAICEKVVIEVSSDGGDTTGYQIPFTLHYTGEKSSGTFNPATKVFKAG